MRFFGSLDRSVASRRAVRWFAATAVSLGGLGSGAVVAQVPAPPAQFAPAQYPPAAGSAFSGYDAPGDLPRSAPPAAVVGTTPSAAPPASPPSLPTVRFFEENGVTYREDLRTGQRIALPPLAGSPRPVPASSKPSPAAQPYAAAQQYAAAQPYAAAPAATIANTAYHPGTPAPAYSAASGVNFVAPATVGGGFVAPAPSVPVATPYAATPYAAAQPVPAVGYAPGVVPVGAASPAAVGAAPAPSVPPGTPGRWTPVLVSDYQYSTRIIGRWNPFRTPMQVTERTPVLRYEWRFTPDAAASGATAVTAQRVIRY